MFCRPFNTRYTRASDTPDRSATCAAFRFSVGDDL
jgi:hypothetical protein